MSKETGGPAFPCNGVVVKTNNGGMIVDSAGVTIRDYFAAQALSTTAGYPAEDVVTWSADDFAMHAYNVADAMLIWRNK